jgi:geranylgeranyl pyrophosphate synthase
MKNYDSIEYTKLFAKRLVRESWGEVNKLLPSSEAKEKLRAFATYLIERRI